MDNNNQLTIDLKTYFDNKFEELEKRNSLRDDLTERYVKKAEDSMSIRLEGMNNIREQLRDQSNSFVNRAEFSLLHKAVEDKIDSLAKTVYIGIGILLVLQILWKYII